MLLRLGFNMEKEADAIEKAVRLTLQAGFRTPDIMSPGCKEVGCAALGQEVVNRLSA